MESITIYHNPACGTSRNTLELIRFSGIEPTVIEYLQTPPTAETLKQLIADMGLQVDEVIRRNVPEIVHIESDEHLTDDDKINLMVQYPILINRPIVITSKGTRLCRPSEKVLEILPVNLPGPFKKEDGEWIHPLA